MSGFDPRVDQVSPHVVVLEACTFEPGKCLDGQHVYFCCTCTYCTTCNTTHDNITGKPAPVEDVYRVFP